MLIRDLVLDIFVLKCCVRFRHLTLALARVFLGLEKTWY